MAKKAQIGKFKKAPEAPRRFKSAYMFFSTEKHKSIRQEHNTKLQTTDVAKMVSQAWKDLPKKEREKWEDMARRDKARYEVEKTMYTGPWKVPATKARSRKDPNAPKRPMSAFLSYSNSKRGKLKATNPEIGNAEVSRILAKMWREAPEEERKTHIDREFQLRQEYKAAIATWRQNADKALMAIRKNREDIALQRLNVPDNEHYQVMTSFAMSVDLPEAGQPPSPNNTSISHQPKEQDVVTSNVESNTFNQAAGVPHTAHYRRGALPYSSLGYPSDSDNSVMPPSPSRMTPRYDSFRRMTGQYLCVDTRWGLPGRQMPVHMHSTDVQRPAEYGVPRHRFEQSHEVYHSTRVGFHGGCYPDHHRPAPLHPYFMAWGGGQDYGAGSSAQCNPSEGAPLQSSYEGY